MFKGSSLLLILGAIVLSGALFCHHRQMTNAKSQGGQMHPRFLEAFATYKRTFGKVYASPEEEAFRLQNFVNTLFKVQAKNAMNLGYTSGLNRFSDLSKEEFKAKYLGYKPNANQAKNVNMDLLKAVPSNDADWRTKPGVVTHVKDQGQCGSCWAFSATGALEGAAALLYKKSMQSFSEQQLVDCSGKYGNEGCNGGLMDQAFQFVIDNGIETEDQYPYKARDQRCQSKVGEFKIGHHTSVPQKSSGALAAACDIQPVSVAIEADEIMSYTGGVFADTNCGSSLDHGVLLVGYTADAWIVKNSWGPNWGEQGYIRMSRTAIPDSKGGICGILTAASYPTV